MDMNKERKFVSVSLPAELIEDIDQKAVGKYGYRSRAGVVTDAIRRFLETLVETKEAVAV